MSFEKVIAIGASEGGLKAIAELLRALPRDLNAALLVVMHIDGHTSYLPSLLASQTGWYVHHANAGEPITSGRVYVARPDLHLLIDRDVIKLHRGPKEHFTRPAIDPLFRSAAEYWGANAAGVVLTGNLSDGTLGLNEIKRASGYAIAQDPDEAHVPDMPASAARYVDVDAVATIAEMAVLLTEWVKRDESLRSDGMSAAIPMKPRPDPSPTSADATNRTPFVCPTCKGSLARTSDVEPMEFACYTGHRFTLETFAHAQSTAADDALWNAYRAMKEKEMVLSMLAQRCDAVSDSAMAMKFNREKEKSRDSAKALLAITEKVPGTFSELE